MERPTKEKPPGDNRYLDAGLGRKWGAQSDVGNGGRRMQMAQGTETSGRGWRLASAGKSQVDGALHQKRRWGECATER